MVLQRELRPSIARVNVQLDPWHAASKHTTAPINHTRPTFTRWRHPTSDYSLPLIYRPRKDERLSWSSWLTCSGRFTHINGHPSTTGRVQEKDRESSPAEDQRPTTVPRHQAMTDFFDTDCLPFVHTVCWRTIMNAIVKIHASAVISTRHFNLACQICSSYSALNRQRHVTVFCPIRGAHNYEMVTSYSVWHDVYIN